MIDWNAAEPRNAAGFRMPPIYGHASRPGVSGFGFGAHGADHAATGHDGLERQVVEGAALVQVFHVAVAGTVERVVDRVLVAIEFQWLQLEFLAQLDVESGRGLAPLAVEQDRRVAVPVEDIGLHGLAQALGAQVVAHIGKTQSGMQA